MRLPNPFHLRLILRHVQQVMAPPAHEKKTTGIGGRLHSYWGFWGLKTLVMESWPHLREGFPVAELGVELTGPVHGTAQAFFMKSNLFNYSNLAIDLCFTIIWIGHYINKCMMMFTAVI